MKHLRLAAFVIPSGQTALITGDNTQSPSVEFLENRELVRPGDRVVTSGDGGVFPGGLLIGQITEDPGGRLRVRLSADFERLEFLRVLRFHLAPVISDPGGIVGPRQPEAALTPPEVGDG